MRRYRSFFSHWQNWLGLFIVAVFIFIAAAAPKLSPQDPENPGTIKIVGETRNNFKPQPPSEIAPLGTLPDQSSVFHSLVWGTRSALLFGVIVSLFSMFIGVLIGTISGYSNRYINDLLMRITDAFLAFPMIAGVILVKQVVTILLSNAGVIFIMGGMGGMATAIKPYFVLPENLSPILLYLYQMDALLVSFILLSWMPYARIMNSVVLRVKNLEYIEAARVSGSRPLTIIFKHILPNTISPAVIMAARDIGTMVILQTTFAFIGFGGDSPWATTLASARDWIISQGGHFDYWWVFLPTTLALVLFGIGWNLLGDGLNDLLNPRNR